MGRRHGAAYRVPRAERHLLSRAGRVAHAARAGDLRHHPAGGARLGGAAAASNARATRRWPRTRSRRSIRGCSPGIAGGSRRAIRSVAASSACCTRGNPAWTTARPGTRRSRASARRRHRRSGAGTSAMSTPRCGRARTSTNGSSRWSISMPSLDWQPSRMWAKTPFKVADIGLNAILHRANRDLLALARRFGTPAEQAEIAARLEATAAAIDRLWNAAARHLSIAGPDHRRAHRRANQRRPAAALGRRCG